MIFTPQTNSYSDSPAIEIYGISKPGEDFNDPKIVDAIVKNFDAIAARFQLFNSENFDHDHPEATGHVEAKYEDCSLENDGAYCEHACVTNGHIFIRIGEKVPRGG